ncbi:hypothetical protein ADUPG1_005872, partial [Aduncisulcus paluster]
NIPKTVTELIMNNVSVPAGKSFSDFTVLTTLSLQSDSTFDSSASTPFPSSLTSLNLSDTTGFTDMSKIPTDVVTLVVDGISLPTSLHFLPLQSSRVSLENLTTLSLQSNDLTDISLLFNLKATLTSLDVSSNKIWLTDGDALSYPTAITLAYSDQDPAAHTSCAYSEDSSFYPTANQPSNTVCKEVWSGVYRTECAMFSYRDYTVESTLTCVSLDDEASIPSCVSTRESNLNTQCVVSSAGGSIQSDCIEKWYGTGCDKECPLQDSALCGTPTYGSCNTTSHEC